jgi:glycosyltransferase involved in cell wall biosynthesis
MSRPEHHVLFVSPLPPPVGGVASWTNTIRKRGLRDGWRNSIVDTRMRGRSVADENTKWITESIRTTRILFNLLWNLILDRPDIVHVNCSMSKLGVFRNALVVAISRTFRVPVVSNLHGNFKPRRRTALSRWTQGSYRFIFRHSARIVTQNTQSREEVQKLGDFASIISIMPNFLDLDEIPDKSEPENERFRIAYLGALLEAKGIATIIETAARSPESDFILVGDAPKNGESSHWIEKAAGLPNVEIIKSLPHTSVLQVLATSDALILPSHSEGSPLTVVEAMAVGLAVVASPVGAIPELIDEPAGGFLIPHDQIDGYVDAIHTLASDRQLSTKIGTYNKNKARKQYDYDHVISRWREIYESII